MTPMLAALVAYALVLIAIGAWIGRGSTAGGFFVSNRALGPGLLGATLLAANIGAAATVGATGLAYREGAAAWWWSGSAGIGSLVLAWSVGPRVWRMAARHGFFTVGDLIEHHYGAAARSLSAVIIWLASFLILAGQLKGAGEVLAAAGHVSLETGSFVAAIVMAAYFVTGGLRSAASVNLIQLGVKLAGFALGTPLALAAAGGLERAMAAHPTPHQFLTSGSPNAGWTALFLLAPAFLFSPGILQKVYGARDERAVRLGVGWNAIGLLLFAVLPVLCGFAAHALYPDLVGKDTDRALPLLMANALPAWLGGLALAAVFSAEMSAGDAVLFMLSTSGARDLYRSLVRPHASDRELLIVARLLAVIAAAVGLLLARRYATVADALGAFYALLGATLAGPILGAVYRPAGAGAALASMALGAGSTLAMQFKVITPLGPWMTPAFAGLAVNLAAYFLLGLAGARTASTPRR